VSVKDAIPRGKSRRASVYAGGGAHPHGVRRADGSLIRFDATPRCVLTNKLEPIGTRIFAR